METRTWRSLRNDYPNESPIRSKFEELNAHREGALIAFLTGGDPDSKTFLSNASALVEGGADIVEIGVPFSDPIADGPVIQASSQRALRAGSTPKKVLQLIREISSSHDVPLVVLTYYNPILAMGPEKFFDTARYSGVSGVVVPDLPVEEMGQFRDFALKHGIDNILLAAPNTSQSRLGQILSRARGFLYLVSLYGVTGPREALSPQALETLKRVKSVADDRIPVSAGFGISSSDHVRTLMKAGADGAIVGSALVKLAAEHHSNPVEAAAQLRNKVAELKKATIC